MAHFELFGRLKKKKPAYGPMPTAGQSIEQAMPSPQQVQQPRIQEHAIATPRAIELINQGLPESDVITALQNEGYSFEEIDSALNEALKSQVTSGQNQADEYTMKKGFDFNSQPPSASRETLAPLPQEGYNQVQVTPEEIINRKFEDIQEMVESLLEDEVGKVMDTVSSSKEKLQQLETRLKAMENSVIDVKKSIDSVKKQLDDTKNDVESKVSEIDPRLNSLEKAFREVIPNIVDSMREIKEIVHGHIEESSKGKGQDSQEFKGYHN